MLPPPDSTPADRPSSGLPRRAFLVALAGSPALLAACTPIKGLPSPTVTGRDAEWIAKAPQFDHYDPRHLPAELEDPTGEVPGTIVVDTQTRYLYLVQPNRKAYRYAVATGAEAYGWTGEATVARKAEWPAWNPTAEMQARWHEARPTPGGPWNPLGARALYLYQGGRDTLYRIHGTNEPEAIGQGVSSGCIRMRNIDAVDLYERTPVGTRVVVR